ncbi:MAG TPA: glucosamine-6-phosphate deaminase [Casimicrobiaceae bacterium]|nr:glucosamine-6-phosphate deaminase [Casimicrobiaceae bacterium]
MRLQVVPDEASLALAAADVICDAVRRRSDAVLALPTGITPIHAYVEVAERVARGAADLHESAVYAVDEFAGATSATPGTNTVFYRDHLTFPLAALHVPDPASDDPDAAVREHARAIERSGGIDLCVLGIGVNGHVAFNEPGSARDSRARVVELAASSREAHAANFGSLDAVPDRGMTLGVADLLAARSLLVLASGAHKASILAAAIEGPETAAVPASWLRSHGDVTWLLDEAAASRLSRR